MRTDAERALGRRVRAVCFVALAVAAAACVGVVIGDHVPQLWRLAFSVAAAFAAYAAMIKVRDGGTRKAYAWQTSALVVVLVLLPAPYVVLVFGAARALAGRVLREPVQKLIFNTALAVICAGAASGISTVFHLYRVHLDWGQVFHGHMLVGLLLATLSTALISPILVALPTSAERHRPVTSGLAALYRTTIIVWFRNFLIALVVIAALDRSIGLTLLVLAALVPLHALSADRATLGRERAAWRRLQRAIDQLRDSDLHALLRVAAPAAAAMLRADAAEITLAEHTGYPIRYATDDAGRADVLPTAETMTATIARTLTTREGDVGALRLFFTRPVSLTETEQATLDAFANALAVALANAVKFATLTREAEERIRAAHTDPVTGLGNLLMLEKEFEMSRRSDQPLAIAVIGLDRFAEVNDILGAHPADLMLRSVAERLAGIVRRCDVVGRLHGAEYVLLLRELSGPEAAVAQAELAVRSLGGTITAEGLDIALDAHTGVACVPEDGTTLAEVVRRARLAMYKARAMDLAVYRYSSDLEPPAMAQVQMLRDLRTALSENQFVLHYQPKFSLRTGLPVAAEALVRWQHPQEGLISPAQFVPLLERCGLIGNLTRYVLDAAIQEGASWYRAGLPLSVAVNLSARNLLDEDLPRFVLDTLARHGLPADRLICEITETAVFSRSLTASTILDALRTAGVGLSLDDFCTGYSSLSLLRERTIDEIKIDRSFVSDLGTGRRSTEIVTALIDLAHRCDIIVTAEGIETKEQQRLLTDLQCDYAQGFLLAKPMPAALARQLFLDSLRVPGGLGPLRWRGGVVAQADWVASLP